MVQARNAVAQETGEKTVNGQKPIRVLHVLGNTRRGGAESRILEIYRTIDRERVQFDFLIHENDDRRGRSTSDELMASHRQNPYDDEFRELGGRIFALPRPDYRPGGTGLMAYRRACRRFFAEHAGEWQVIQGHMTSTAAVYLKEAKRSGIPVTIAHARSAGTDPGLKGLLTRFLRRPLSDPRQVDWRFACSSEAGHAVFGSAPTVILPNAVSVDTFAWDPEKRAAIRREFGLEPYQVVGHVGSFRYAKNHEFLLRVFRRLCDSAKEDRYRLLMLGEGELLEEMKQLAAGLGISDRVIFAGTRGDVADVCQAMDVFAFPSRYEGMPGSVVEAQASGLPCLVSDRVTQEVGVTELVRFLSIGDERTGGEEEEALWAAQLSEILAQESPKRRAERNESIPRKLREAGFDVTQQTAMLQDFYMTGRGLSSGRKLMLMLPMLHQGGFERVAVATARLLSRDYEVTVCIFSDKNIHYDIRGLHIENLNVPSSKNRLCKVFNVWRRISRARRLKKKLGIDITYSFGNTANPVNVFSRRQDRIITGLRCETDLESPRLVRLAVRRSDLVLSCSGEIRDRLITRFGCRRAAVVYNPLDVEDIRRRALGNGSERPETGTFTIATMGRDDVIKGHWHLIRAFSAVCEKHPEARLLIIGAGRYESVRRLAEKLGVADRITFTGALTDPFPVMAGADLYVLSSNREGFPNALVEAMALSLPVIATDCRTGPREILLSDEERKALPERGAADDSIAAPIDGAYGIMTPDMSAVPDEEPVLKEEGEKILAGQIIRMMEDPQLRAHYAKAAGERALMFTPENYRGELLAVLDNVMKQKGCL